MEQAIDPLTEADRLLIEIMRDEVRGDYAASMNASLRLDMGLQWLERYHFE